MGSYFTDKWDGVTEALAFIAGNPGFFLLMLVIFGPLIWLKWWAVGKATTNATRNLTHGLRADADRRTETHETGIGTQEVLVMRPAGIGAGIWLALMFFGSGAVFFALVVLQDAPTAKDWWTFAGLSTFTLVAMIAIEVGQTRIYLRGQSLERRRVLHRRQIVQFAGISEIVPTGKSYRNGIRITTHSGQKLRIGAGFSGYRELLRRLAPHHPPLAPYLRQIPKAP